MNLRPKTIFCDIDGTLIKHFGDIEYNYKNEPELLNNVLDTIKQWDKLNYKIILTTGRKESMRRRTEEQLSQLNIIYDLLIMGIANGDRVLINDRKKDGARNTAYSINVVRNKGFDNIDLNTQNVTINDLSLDKIYNDWGYEELIEVNDRYVVKKISYDKPVPLNDVYTACLE